MATAPQQPTPIPALPVPPTLADPENFDERGDAFVGALPQFRDAANALGAVNYDNALIAYTSGQASQQSAGQSAASAITAGTHAGTASSKAAEASASAGQSAASAATSGQHATTSGQHAVNSATARAGSEAARDTSVAARNASAEARDASRAYRDQAQTFATQQLRASSTTSVAPSAGSKTFVIEPSRSFVPGMYLVATSQGDLGTTMSGFVQSYNVITGALVLSVDMYKGSAARADWTIGVATPGAATSLTRQEVAANTVCVAGVAYVVTTAGITLTLPASWQPDDRIAIIEAIGSGAVYWIAFGATRLRGRALGTQQISSNYGGTGVLTYNSAARGLV